MRTYKQHMSESGRQYWIDIFSLYKGHVPTIAYAAGTTRTTVYQYISRYSLGATLGIKPAKRGNWSSLSLN